MNRYIDDKLDGDKLELAAKSLLAALEMFTKQYDNMKEEHGHLMDEKAYIRLVASKVEIRELIEDLSN